MSSFVTIVTVVTVVTTYLVPNLASLNYAFLSLAFTTVTIVTTVTLSRFFR